MTYIGITRGENGTIGIIPEEGEPIFVSVPIRKKSYTKIGLDYKKFAELMKPYAAIELNEAQSKVVAKAVVEEPLYNKSQFRASVNQARIFEGIVAILDALGITVQTVQPSKWHYQLFIGKFRKSSAKQASIDYAAELFPQFIQKHQHDRFGICLADWLARGIQYEWHSKQYY